MCYWAVTCALKEKQGQLLSEMWRHGSPETNWGNILEEGTAGAGFLGQKTLDGGTFLHS